MVKFVPIIFFLLFYFLPLQALSESKNSLNFDFSKKPVLRKTGDKLVPWCSHAVKNSKDYLPCIRELALLSRVMIKHTTNGEKQFSMYVPAWLPADKQKNTQQQKKSLFSPILMDESGFLSSSVMLNFFTIRKVKADEREQTDKEPEFVDIQNVAFDSEGTGVLRIIEPTLTLPASVLVKKIPGYPGCFIPDKQGEGITTEAEASCMTCSIKENPDPDIVSPEMFEAFVSLQPTIEGLVDFGSQSKGDVFHQIIGSGDDVIEKICEPEKSLKPVIAKFNKSCPEPYKNNFKDFVREIYCQSCDRGIPPEIVLSIMSMNDKGMCNVQWDEAKGVYLPFSIDPKSHTCQNGQKRKADIKQCLQNPINHVNTGLDVVAGFYTKANNPPPVSLPGKCKPWVFMTDDERDTWRRGGSSLHSNDPDLMQKTMRALSTILSDIRFYKEKNPRDFAKMMRRIGIEDLEVAISKVVEVAPKCYQIKDGETISWPETTVCLFVQMLVSEDVVNRILEPGMGRLIRQVKVRNNMENYARAVIKHIAYVEAVLGSEVKGSSYGMVDFWNQYLINNKPNCDDSLDENVKEDPPISQV